MQRSHWSHSSLYLLEARAHSHKRHHHIHSTTTRRARSAAIRHGWRSYKLEWHRTVKVRWADFRFSPRRSSVSAHSSRDPIAVRQLFRGVGDVAGTSRVYSASPVWKQSSFERISDRSNPVMRARWKVLAGLMRDRAADAVRATLDILDRLVAAAHRMVRLQAKSVSLRPSYDRLSHLCWRTQQAQSYKRQRT